MKILLISANDLTTPYPVYPVGLDYVAGAIAHRHQVKIADINLMEDGELSALISTFKPDVVGISLRNVDNSDIEDPKLFIGGHRDLCTKIRQNTDACSGSVNNYV